MLQFQETKFNWQDYKAEVKVLCKLLSRGQAITKETISEIHNSTWVVPMTNKKFTK